MSTYSEVSRYLVEEPEPHLQRPVARLQPVLATEGKPSVNIAKLGQVLNGYAALEDMIVVRSAEHWDSSIRGLGGQIDAILPLSIPAYPTEVWNSHPQPLVDRGLPVVFWSLVEHEEPDFWRWSARDFLRTLGVDVHLVSNNREGAALVKALAMRRFLKDTKLVVFGEQNFPWNAFAVGDRVAGNLGTEIIVRPLADIRALYPGISTSDVRDFWELRKGSRYVEKSVDAEELWQALRTCLAIRKILEEEKALGFGVNCFGDLIINGGRDVPCLAQCLLREEGYIASCDGDFIAMMSMVLSTFFLDKPCMMSNMYPVSYVGALTDHFGDPLSPGAGYPRHTWQDLARFAHCGFAGIISPEMTLDNRVYLCDWGGTYEIKRDGRGCGIDGDLAADEEITVIELCFDARRLLVAKGRVCETTRHDDMPHCESSALLEFRDLEGFIENISREHAVILYGDYVREFEILAYVLGLECLTF